MRMQNILWIAGISLGVYVLLVNTGLDQRLKFT